MVIFQLPFAHFPQANFIYRSAVIRLADWAKILGFALLVYFLVEIEKALRQRMKQKK
jgi:hypothetical protein